ncbi:DUF3999 domain-containing protein [Pseudomonas borbori]
MNAVLRKVSLAMLVWVAGTTIATAGAQEQASDYAVRAPLTLSGEGPWYRLALPMDVHLAARYADLRDLRVFNGEGQAQAYALVHGSARPRETPTETAVKWFPLQGPRDAEQALGIRVQRSTAGTLIEVVPESTPVGAQQELRGWLLDTSAVTAPLHALILDWSSEREGFQRFSIEASDDLQQWRTWGEGQIARLSFADERIDQRKIDLPRQTARYLRLLWLGDQQAPQLVSAHVLSASGDLLPEPLTWSAELTPSSVKAAEYTWVLPSALPLQRIQVGLTEANSLAPVSVVGRRDGEVQWQPLARGLLYRLPQNGKDVLHNELELYGAPVRQLRLLVDERGGGLGASPTIRIGIRSTELVFLARGTPPYTLAIGNAAGKAADLPLSTLIPGYDEPRLATLGLATAASAPTGEVAAAVEQQGAFDWKRLGLWGVLLAGVGLLALMAISLLRAKPEDR